MRARDCVSVCVNKRECACRQPAHQYLAGEWEKQQRDDVVVRYGWFVHVCDRVAPLGIPHSRTARAGASVDPSEKEQALAHLAREADVVFEGEDQEGLSEVLVVLDRRGGGAVRGLGERWDVVRGRLDAVVVGDVHLGEGVDCETDGVDGEDHLAAQYQRVLGLADERKVEARDDDRETQHGDRESDEGDGLSLPLAVVVVDGAFVSTESGKGPFQVARQVQTTVLL